MPTPIVFISYRRGQESPAARLLEQHLTHRLWPRASIFRDTSLILPGDELKRSIDEALEQSVAVIAFISRDWEPTEWIRYELGYAFARGVHVIPVVIEGAPAPSERSLPAELQQLAKLTYQRLADTSWESDLEKILNALQTRTALAPIPTHTAGRPRSLSQAWFNGRHPQRATAASEFRRALAAEISGGLGIDIFSRNWEGALLARAAKDPVFMSLAGRKPSVRASVDRRLTVAAQRGVDSSGKLLKRLRDRPLTIALHPAQSGSLAIFEHLRTVHRLPIWPNLRFAYSSEISGRAKVGSLIEVAQACVLPAAASAHLMSDPKRNQLVSVLPMPAVTHRIVTTPAAADWHRLRFAFVGDQPTSSQLLFERLRRFGAIAKTKSVDMRHDEVSSALFAGNGDIAAISWFPNFWIYEQAGVARAFSPDANPQGHADLSLHTNSWLFLHQSLASDPNFVSDLSIAIRDAWLTLQQHRPALRNAVEHILADSNYVEMVGRFAGFPRAA